MSFQYYNCTTGTRDGWSYCGALSLSLSLTHTHTHTHTGVKLGFDKTSYTLNMTSGEVLIKIRLSRRLDNFANSKLSNLVSMKFDPEDRLVAHLDKGECESVREKIIIFIFILSCTGI